MTEKSKITITKVSTGEAIILEDERVLFSINGATHNMAACALGDIFNAGFKMVFPGPPAGIKSIDPRKICPEPSV